jgi:hypothetical protein
MTRKSTLSPESVAVIEHLKTHGASTAVALLPHFPGVDKTLLLKRLGNLVALGWLDFNWNEDGKKAWFVRSSARAIPVHAAAPRESERAVREAPPAPELVQPRRINVMVGDYVPPRGPTLRPGALDFKHCPSVGFRC